MKVFIIPYRDRPEHKHFFLTYIKHILPDDNYEIYFAHQLDNRPFNRGAMKNIGFLAMKKKYPNDYKDISFIFNDVDIMPYKEDIFHYDTESNVIKHNYGYYSCLSASFVIKGQDFERVNGFPNIWSWGLEDYIIQNRAIEKGIIIDRSRFRPLGSKCVLQLFDGITRKLSKKPIEVKVQEHLQDGLSSIKNLNYTIEDNMIQVKSFDALKQPEEIIDFPLNKINTLYKKRWSMF
jgi:hypothetical protein